MALATLRSLKPEKDNITVTSENFSIGRLTTNSCVIISPEISRRHCVIQKVDGEWTICDKSTNGILVNGKCVKKNEPVKIANNTRFTLSENYLFVFECEKQEEVGSNSETILDAILPNSGTKNSDKVEKRRGEHDYAKPSVSQEIVKTDAELKDEPPAPCIAAPVAESSQSTVTNPTANQNVLLDDSTQEELQCSICLELFIHPVTVNCSHTFCDHCLKKWRETKNMCPICRVKIKTASHTRVIETIINKVLLTVDEETKQARAKIIADREKDKPKTPARESPLTISISSDEDQDDDDDFDDYSSYGGDSFFDDEEVDSFMEYYDYDL